MMSDAELNQWGASFMATVTRDLTHHLEHSPFSLEDLSFQEVWDFIHHRHPTLTPEQAQWVQTFLEEAFQR